MSYWLIKWHAQLKLIYLLAVLIQMKDSNSENIYLYRVISEHNHYYFIITYNIFLLFPFFLYKVTRLIHSFSLIFPLALLHVLLTCIKHFLHPPPYSPPIITFLRKSDELQTVDLYLLQWLAFESIMIHLILLHSRVTVTLLNYSDITYLHSGC